MTTPDPANLQTALGSAQANRQQYDDLSAQLATLTDELAAFQEKGDVSDPDALLGMARRRVTADTIPNGQAALDAALPPINEKMFGAIAEFETALLAVAAEERKALVAAIEPILEPFAPRHAGEIPARALALALPVVATIPATADQLGTLALYKGDVENKRARSAIARANELLGILASLTQTGGFTPAAARASAGIRL